jgi:hypothetical protein
MLLGASGVLALGFALFAVVGQPSVAVRASSAARSSTVARAHVPAAPLPAVNAPTAIPAAVPLAIAVQSVEVHVRTQPSGAQVAVDGLGRVCLTTPCVFQAPRGRELTLRVRSKSASIVRTLVFDDATDLDLRLAGATRNMAARVPEKLRAPGDLKVPALFR